MKYLVIVPYQDTFQWSLSIEFALSLVAEGKDVTLVSCEVVELRNVKRLLALKFGYSYLRSEVLSNLSSKGVNFLSLQTLVWRTRTEKIFREDGTLNMEDELVRVAAASVGDTLRTGTLLDNKKTKRIFRRQMSSARALATLLDQVLLKYCEIPITVFTVNGRYTLNKTIKEYFRNRNISTLMLEYGKGLSYTVWEDAQSMREVESKSIQLWGDGLTSESYQLAINHMNARLLSGKGVNATYTRNMESGRLPEFPANRKICIFFSTSQIEFLFLDDRIPKSDYQNQQEALHDLISTLGKEWHVFLRRHPYGNNNKFGDDEASRWDEFRCYENLTIIEPDEPVDSYELARNADLTAHFGSSIGADLIFMNSCPVISLGPTEWEHAQKHSKVRNLGELQSFLSSGFVKEKPEGILPWAYFYETRGEPFRYIWKDDEGQTFYESIELTIPIREWVLSLPGKFKLRVKSQPKEAKK